MSLSSRIPSAILPFSPQHFFFFSSRRRHTRYWRDWSSDVCSSDLHRLPPVLVRREAMFGTGFLPTDEQQIFRTADDDLYLAGTSEVPLVSYHSDELLDLVPPRGRLLRQGHPWHLPGPPVRQGRDGVLRAPRGLGGRAPAAAGPRGGDPPGHRAPLPGGR